MNSEYYLNSEKLAQCKLPLTIFTSKWSAGRYTWSRTDKSRSEVAKWWSHEMMFSLLYLVDQIIYYQYISYAISFKCGWSYRICTPKSPVLPRSDKNVGCSREFARQWRRWKNFHSLHTFSLLSIKTPTLQSHKDTQF